MFNLTFKMEYGEVYLCYLQGGRLYLVDDLTLTMKPFSQTIYNFYLVGYSLRYALIDVEVYTDSINKGVDSKIVIDYYNPRVTDFNSNRTQYFNNWSGSQVPLDVLLTSYNNNSCDISLNLNISVDELQYED